MTLSGLRRLDKSAIVCFLFVVSGKSEPQCRKLLVSFEPAKAFLGFVHGRSGPAQSHRRRTPALHIAGDTTHGAHHIFDDVGAGHRAPQFRRKTEPAHCEDFIQSLEDAFSDARGRRAPCAGRDCGSISPLSPHRRVPRLVFRREQGL